MRRVKHILINVLVLCMCFTLFFFPLNVFADSPTYTPYESGTCQLFFDTRYFNSSVSGRLVTLKYGNDFYTYFVADPSVQTQFTYSQLNNNACSLSMNSYSKVYNYSGTYYFYAQLGPYSWSSTVDNMPIVVINLDHTGTVKDAIDYTFGSKSVDPSPITDWGKPANVMYNTRIAGSGSASENNIDRIVWSPYIDSKANDLPISAKVQIRAVPGSYTADSQPNLLLKTYQDFVLDHSKQYLVYDGPAHLGRFEIKWGEVVDHFNFFPYSWVPDIQFVDDYYLKMGWIYQIRLIIEDEEYESDWINIYTATSSGVEPSEVITDSNELSQQLVENILIVNTLNENTTVNWQINDTTINNSTYTEPGNGEKPWWSYLLEAIISLLNPNDETNVAINVTNNGNQELNNKLNEYNQIEDQQITNLDNSLEDITVESSMLSDFKFVSSAQWVAQQYNRITTGTVIGSIIGFSLLFGLALIFIGKIR